MSDTSKANTIAVINHGVFLVSFKVVWEGGESPSTPSFGNGNSESIDLRELNIQQGTMVWPEVDVVLGRSTSCTVKFPYDPQGDTQCYEASGSSLSPQCAYQRAGVCY